jgi:hypothetical protein
MRFPNDNHTTGDLGNGIEHVFSIEMKDKRFIRKLVIE